MVTTYVVWFQSDVLKKQNEIMARQTEILEHQHKMVRKADARNDIELVRKGLDAVTDYNLCLVKLEDAKKHFTGFPLRVGGERRPGKEHVDEDQVRLTCDSAWKKVLLFSTQIKESKRPREMSQVMGLKYLLEPEEANMGKYSTDKKFLDVVDRTTKKPR